MAKTVISPTGAKPVFINIKPSFFNRIKAFFNSKLKIGIGLVVVALLIFGAVRLFGSKSSGVTYQTGTVTRGTVVSTIDASGTVMTANIVDISTNASGVVKKVYVKDGDKVTAGQKIADITLDTSGQQKNAQAWSSYLSAKNSLASANANYYTQQAAEFSANQKFINDAVARNLSTSDPTYIQEYATWKAAEAAFNNQTGQVAQTQSALTSSWLSYQATAPTVVAPMAGTVSNVSLVEGMVLSSSNSTTTISNQRVAVINNGSKPILSFNLTEVDVPKVKVGQKATVTLDSLLDKSFTGTVMTVDRIGSTSSNVTSYPIIIQLDTDSESILPNMTANASVIVETKTDVLMVPSTAVKTSGGVSTVQKMVNGKPENVTVEIGISSDSDTEIVSGLSDGDTVVTATITSSSNKAATGTSSSIFGGSNFGALRGATGGNATFRTTTGR